MSPRKNSFISRGASSTVVVVGAAKVEYIRDERVRDSCTGVLILKGPSISKDRTKGATINKVTYREKGMGIILKLGI